MVMDRNNRSHRPKGTPDGGRYEAGHTTAAAADVRPPITAGGDTTVMGRARERGLSWDMLAGRGGNGRAANLTARGGENWHTYTFDADGLLDAGPATMSRCHRLLERQRIPADA